ncbi:MAG: hypothetical protein SVM86_07975 [Candidatus Cloacimonadota bacterium]|nr:hypothetical protein [Candidatus Cloacimonadota bacterium]
MKKFVYLFLFLLLASCIQVESMVEVNKDGSGTLVQKVLIGNQFMQGMKQMAQGFDSKEEETEEGIFDEEDLRAAAEKYGESVTFVSARKLEVNNMTGYEAIYEFTDIEALSISSNPEEDLMNMGDSDLITFKFKKGNTARLDIIMPPEFEDEEIEEKDIVNDEEDLQMDENTKEMVKQLYKDMKIAMTIKVNGRITKTNCSYQEDNSVVLMKIDFQELLKDEKAMELMGSNNANDPEVFKELIESIPGTKIEGKEEIFVEFK